MTLRVLVPAALALERTVVKVSAHTERGSFCLLPRHRDFVADLAPGIVGVRTPEGRDEYYAADGGTLVKVGANVMISTRRLVGPGPLGTLKETVRRELRTLDDRERKARATMARLEAALARRLLDLERHAAE